MTVLPTEGQLDISPCLAAGADSQLGQMVSALPQAQALWGGQDSGSLCFSGCAAWI